jgi:hypothetical protein
MGRPGWNSARLIVRLVIGSATTGAHLRDACGKIGVNSRECRRAGIPREGTAGGDASGIRGSDMTREDLRFALIALIVIGLLTYILISASGLLLPNGG